MSTITTRSGKGSPLTNNEVDANFTNLNTDKAELSGAAFTGAITTNSTFDGRDVATDGTKLDGIEANADVTDATNVTAAGALMDGELTAIASVKALNQGVATTDSPTFSNLTLSGTDSVKVPSGTTGQRNGSPANGMFRYNSTTAEFEGYQDGAWGSIGGGSADITLNQFTGDGSDTTFTLSGLAAENNTFVYIDGVYQSKDNYTVSAADPAVLTFSTAPPNTTAIEVMVAAISVSNIGTPSDNTVSTAKIVDGAVTTAKIADDAVTPAKIASGDFNFAKSDQTNGATLSITNSFSGGGWDAGDILGSLNFRTDDTSTTQPIRGQIKVFEDSASGTTYPNSNAMSFSTGLNNDLTERMRIASDGIEISNGAIALKNAGTQSKIDLYCESSNAHYTRIQSAPHSSYTGNVVLTLPASDGDAGQVLQTDGSGVMSWATSGGDTVTYGTFTPTVVSGTVNTANGSWMRVGDMVTVTFRLFLLSDTSSSTAIQILLPFTCKSGIGYQAYGAANNSKQAYADDTVFQITHNTAYATPFRRFLNAGSYTSAVVHSLLSSNNTLQGTLTYRVA
jgi:hypothetical protein